MKKMCKKGGQSMNLKKDNRGIAKSAVIIIIAIVAALAIGGAIFASTMMKKRSVNKAYHRLYEDI